MEGKIAAPKWKKCVHLRTRIEDDRNVTGSGEEGREIRYVHYCHISKGKGMMGDWCIERDDCPHLELKRWSRRRI